LRQVGAEVERLSRETSPSEERSALVEELNFRFHRTINQLPDAARLRWFLRAATRYVPRHFYESIPGWLDTTVSDHPQIIEALEQRDGALARRLVEQHVLSAGELIVSHLDQRGMWLDERSITPDRRVPKASG
jgi:DNA-binding GntR family transcriptional regulator